MLLIFFKHIYIYIYIYLTYLFYRAYLFYLANFFSKKLCKQLFYLFDFLKTTNNFIPFQINFEVKKNAFMQGSNLIFQADLKAQRLVDIFLTSWLFFSVFVKDVLRKWTITVLGLITVLEKVTKNFLFYLR